MGAVALLLPNNPHTNNEECNFNCLGIFTIKLSAQLTVPQSGVNNYTVCSGTFYDSGGPSGSYVNNSNGYTILNPSNPGKLIRVNGSSIGESVSDVESRVICKECQCNYSIGIHWVCATVQYEAGTFTEALRTSVEPEPSVQ